MADGTGTHPALLRLNQRQRGALARHRSPPAHRRKESLPFKGGFGSFRTRPFLSAKPKYLLYTMFIVKVDGKTSNLLRILQIASA
jgi:hypothetical protein